MCHFIKFSVAESYIGTDEAVGNLLEHAFAKALYTKLWETFPFNKLWSESLLIIFYSKKIIISIISKFNSFAILSY